MKKKEGFDVKKNKFVSKHEIVDIFHDEAEMDLIIDYLKSIERCDTCLVNDVIFIKFNSEKPCVQKVNEDEMNLLKLHILCKSISSEIKTLEHSVSESKKAIKQHLMARSRTQAKYELKRMKRDEATMEKKLIVLNNLESITDSVESASSQIDVINAYKAGSVALKNELKRNKSAEKAAEILDDVNYYMNEVKEISDILSNEASLDTSDDDLNEELDKLLKEESKQDDLVKQLDDLEIAAHEPEVINLDDGSKNSHKTLENCI